jgi:hypothetical protein
MHDLGLCPGPGQGYDPEWVAATGQGFDIVDNFFSAAQERHRDDPGPQPDALAHTVLAVLFFIQYVTLVGVRELTRCQHVLNTMFECSACAWMHK